MSPHGDVTAAARAEAMTAYAMLQRLQDWRGRGWLRPLDLAFARFIHAIDGQAPPGLLQAAALLAHLESRGHSAMPLAIAGEDLWALLGWPDDAAASLNEAMAGGWPDSPLSASTRGSAWAASAVLQTDPVDDRGLCPLVLSDGRLYLRRHWRDERRVAAQVMSRARAVTADDWPAPKLQQARSLMEALFPPAARDDAAAGPANTDRTESADRTDWQRVACALGLRGRITLISGGPGTGKTYTAARLLVLLHALHDGAHPLRVALAAPTGKAAARLRQSIDAALNALPASLGTGLGGPEHRLLRAPARTLHALLGVRRGSRRFVHDAQHPLPLDLLFVDEASMVHLEMMAALLQALPGHARLVLLGDRDQLASVEAGAVLADLCQAAPDPRPSRATAAWVQALSGQLLSDTAAGPGHALAQQTVVLRHSRRFGGPIGQLAQAVNRGDARAALAMLDATATPSAALALQSPAAATALPALALAGRGGAALGYRATLAGLAQRPDASPGAFEAWAQQLLQQFERCRVLCAVREGPWGVLALNQAIERELLRAGLLKRRGEWYEGRPVMVTRNEPALGLANGDIGLVLRPPHSQPAEASDATALAENHGPAADPVGLKACFLDGGSIRSLAVGRLAAVETAFAMTVHKSQGSEFDHVMLVLPPEDSPVLTRELLYTGITRARQALTLVLPDDRRLASACARLTRRLSGLREMLQVENSAET